jgi:hypothetical protein
MSGEKRRSRGWLLAGLESLSRQNFSPLSEALLALRTDKSSAQFNQRSYGAPVAKFRH